MHLPRSERIKDALLHEENVENLEQEGMHECLEEVEEEINVKRRKMSIKRWKTKTKRKGENGIHGLLHKVHNNKAKIGWANRVWDPGKSSIDHHWEVTHCMGALRSLNPRRHTNFKHWWGFKDEFQHKPP
ncbi:hypothetical protein PIB30_070048 [Stylosanthes scabra]|uniref:Uncharacterized protein n=1 Tax=Stylosanthes scabra TaxID=79078 RepID=A0ABU6VMC7_9FABA|nr:hypothetical protein [Stylosanthes scabra]